MLQPDSDYTELSEMHSPKKMLQIIGQVSAYGALPRLDKRGLRDCQYRAEVAFENSIKHGTKKSLAVLATGSGKTYLACLASYELLSIRTKLYVSGRGRNSPAVLPVNQAVCLRSLRIASISSSVGTLTMPT